MPDLKILISYDHDLVRRGLFQILSLETDFSVVGETSSTAQAVIEADRLKPDILLMDLRMPEMNGRMAAEYIKQQHPYTRIILLSGAEIDEDIFDALETGIDGYVSKEASPHELTSAIRIVAGGERYIHALVTNSLLKRLKPSSYNTPLVRPKFTEHERNVLRLLPAPLTYQEIGKKLTINEAAVRGHVTTILSKLGQSNRTQAVIESVRLGLINIH